MKRRTVLLATGGLLALSGCLFDDEEEHEFHGRGEIDVVVDGSPIDLSQDKFQAEYASNESLAFHLHEFDDYWYMEGDEPVTVATGIDLLPYFEHTEETDGHVVTYDGTTYDSSEPDTEMTFLVNDERVDPTEYVLADGDEIVVEIETETDDS
ncbi:hypothetical protein ACLI4Z_10475 [Natrialbaceae archaeon A-arb3/5]